MGNQYPFLYPLFTSFCSILAEAKNLSFNATAAFNAYSNIKANVDAAEKEAKAARQRASEALNLVREFNSVVIHINCQDAVQNEGDGTKVPFNEKKP